MKNIFENILHRNVEEPPQEILRPNESITEVSKEDFTQAVEKMKPGRMKSLLQRYGIAFLTFFTLAGNPSFAHAPENSLPDKEKNKLEQVDETPEAPEGTVPEVVIYGDVDNRTDAIVNYLSGKDALPESMREELSVRLFITKAIKVSNILTAQENFDKNDPRTYFEEDVKSRLKKLDEGSFAKYIENKEYIADMIDYQLATMPSYYLENNKLNETSLAGKLAYLKTYYGGLMGSMKEGDAIRNMSDADFEKFIIERSTDANALKVLFTKGDFSVKKYNTVWTMQHKYGDPRVDLTYNFENNMGGGTRAYYTSKENKMNLGVQLGEKNIITLDSWLAELSHSKQYNQTNLTLEELERIDQLNIMEYILEHNIQETVMEDGEAYENFYDSEVYNIPGTIEYEAHKQIQPELTKELEEGINN